MKTLAERLDYAPTAEEWLTHLEERLHALELKVKRLTTEGVSLMESKEVDAPKGKKGAG